MPEATVAVYRGDFTFDHDALDALILARWPEARYVETSPGRLAEYFAGTYHVVAADGTSLAVEVDRNGTALYPSAVDAGIAADFIEVVTALPGFPDDGSAVLAESVDDSVIIPLRPRTPAGEPLALLD